MCKYTEKIDNRVNVLMPLRPRARRSFRPSVLPSVSPSVGQSVSQSVTPSVRPFFSQSVSLSVSQSIRLASLIYFRKYSWGYTGKMRRFSQYSIAIYTNQYAVTLALRTYELFCVQIYCFSLRSAPSLGLFWKLPDENIVKADFKRLTISANFTLNIGDCMYSVLTSQTRRWGGPWSEGISWARWVWNNL